MPSIVDVARKAKVAPSTVSLVINHSDNVSADTRKRVETAIEQLGYVPRRRRARKAQAARPTTPSRHIAIVYTQHAVCNGEMTTLCREWITGIRKALEKQNAHLSIIGGLDHVDRDLMFQQNLEADELDGVILFGPRAANGYLDRLLGLGLPVVAMNRRPEADEFGCVSVDFAGGIRQAASYLAKQGHTRVGVLASHPADPCRHAQVAGVEVVDLNDSSDRPGGRRAVRPTIAKLAQQVIELELTAFYTGDFQAIALVDQLEKMGVRVPEDVSVVGFDDTGLRTASGRRLTSIGYDKQLMGRLAVRLLMQMISPRARLQSGTLVVPTHVVDGQTVASPSAE